VKRALNVSAVNPQQFNSDPESLRESLPQFNSGEATLSSNIAGFEAGHRIKH